MELTNLIVGAVVASLFGVVAYFLQRLISRNDKFQDETSANFKTIRKELSDQRITLANLKTSIETKLEHAGLDTKTKAKVSSLLASVAQVEKDLVKIKPALDKANETGGKIIWIIDKVEAQDKKLRTMYEALEKIVITKPRKP